MATASYDFEGTTGALPGTLSGTYGSWTVSSGPAGTSSDYDVSTTVAKTGSKSGRVNSTTTSAGHINTASISGTIYYRGYWRFPANPSASVSLFVFFDSGYSRSHQVGIDTSGSFFQAAGKTSLSSDVVTAASSSTSSTGLLAADEWFRVEVAANPTAIRTKVWKASGAGADSNGAPDWDPGTLTVSNIGTIADSRICTQSYISGSWSTFLSSGYAYHDDFAASDVTWVGPSTTTHTAAAAASETASATAAATSTRVLAGTPSITATAEANAGLVLTAAGAPSITASGAADASVITTHNAEAASIITIGSTDTLSLTQGMVAASTITASATAVGATNTAANGAVQAIGAARAVVDGETSPGFLYATVAKNILTN